MPAVIGNLPDYLIVGWQEDNGGGYNTVIVTVEGQTSSLLHAAIAAYEQQRDARLYRGTLRYNLRRHYDVDMAMVGRLPL